MFQIREDVYRRRELADKLKIAFATAAHIAIGPSLACFIAGSSEGPLLYATSLGLCFTFTTAGMFWRKSAPPGAVPFDAIAPVAQKIAQKAGIEPPQVFHVPFKEQESSAYTDGQNVFFDTKFVREADLSDIAALLAHEMAHIKNGDARYDSLVLSPLSLASLAVIPFLAFNGFLAFSLKPVLLSTLLMQTVRWFYKSSEHLNNFASRAQERRADRLAAKWVDCPLDIAISLKNMPDKKDPHDKAWRQWQEPQKYSFEWSLMATHPDTGDRIRDIVTLCKHVPNLPAEKPPALSL